MVSASSGARPEDLTDWRLIMRSCGVLTGKGTAIRAELEALYNAVVALDKELRRLAKF